LKHTSNKIGLKAHRAGGFMLFKTCFTALALPCCLLAQTAIFKPYQNSSMSAADTLYLGASFLYTGATTGGKGNGFGTKKFGPAEPIQVTLKSSEAGWTGELWAIVQSATGKEETVFLFTNKDAPGTSVDLRKKVSFAIPSGAEITFMYTVIQNPCASCSQIPAECLLPKYSGPNRGSDKYHSIASSEKMYKPNFRFGGRWSVVTRNSADDLEFGFEDNTQASSDMDFDDVIFTVSNLQMGVFNRKLLTKNLVR
jgi:hypothetical protein